MQNEVQQRLKYFEDKKKEEDEKKKAELPKNNDYFDGWKNAFAMKFQSKVSIIIEENADGFSDSIDSNMNLASTRNSHLVQNSTSKKSNHSRQDSNGKITSAQTPT